MNVDYADVAADLRGRRDAIDQILDGLAKLSAPTAPAVAVASPPTLTPRGSGRRPQAAPDALERMRLMYERGEDVVAIAEAGGVGQSTVYGYASRLHWKRGEKPVAGEGKATPRRRCDDCQQVVNQTPCPNCGKEWP